MNNANYKKWLYSGVAIFIVSNVAGLVGLAAGIYSSFDAMRAPESAGIDAVGDGIGSALFFTFFFLITGFVGFLIFILGILKMRRFKSPK